VFSTVIKVNCSHAEFHLDQFGSDDHCYYFRYMFELNSGQNLCIFAKFSIISGVVKIYAN